MRMMGPENGMPDIADTVIEDDQWSDLDIDALGQRAFVKTLSVLGLEPSGFEIALLACNDARISELNSDFRGKPAATNVLSWPETDLAPDKEGARPHAPALSDGPFPTSLGDIAIAFETCAAEAAAQNKTFSDHVTHLLVHGCLHLLGYDHVSDKDATLMEELEVEILAKLGIANPY